MTDALQTVWNALEAHGCGPHGQPFDFRARCPEHGGDNRDSLHVQIGGDGRALLWCFAHGCRTEDIVAKLGIDIRDLFPPGARRARRRQLPSPPREDLSGNVRAVVNMLAAVAQLGREWYLELRTDCAHCGSPAALVQASDRFLVFSCPGDDCAGCTACTLDHFRQLLAARLGEAA